MQTCRVDNFRKVLFHKRIPSVTLTRLWAGAEALPWPQPSEVPAWPYRREEEQWIVEPAALIRCGGGAYLRWREVGRPLPSPTLMS